MWENSVICSAIEWLQISKQSFYLKIHWQPCCQNIAHDSANKGTMNSWRFKKGQGFREGAPTFKISKQVIVSWTILTIMFSFFTAIIVKHNQNLTSKTRNACFNFLYHARFQPSSEVLMKSFSWVVMQCILTVVYRHFRQPIGPVFKDRADREPWPLNMWPIGRSETSVSVST